MNSADLDTRVFIHKARRVHGSVYDYSKAAYEFADVRLVITCPKHGDFEQTPTHHLRGSGCPACGLQRRRRKLRKSVEEWVQDFQARHGDLYGYEEIIAIEGGSDKIPIICRIHGKFLQDASNHARGRGCPECAAVKNRDKRGVTEEEMIARFRKAHGDAYDYSDLGYTKVKGRVRIGCFAHGVFIQVAGEHAKGRGCPECARERLSSRQTLTKNEFIEKAREVHGNAYSYGDVEYVHSQTDVVITCEEHGPFMQTPSNHLQGTRCPKCVVRSSRLEETVAGWLGELGITYERHDRSILRGKELDFYIPHRKLAIEVNGLYWHRHEHLQDRLYHTQKFRECEAAGVALMQFWCDDILQRPEIVKSMLANKLGVTNRRIYARKCDVVDLSSSEYRHFMEENHLQGSVNASTRLGLVFGGELVVAVGVSKMGDGVELSRLASKRGVVVVGGFGKLLSRVGQLHAGKLLVSYSFNAYSRGEVYRRMGFELVGENDVTLFYTDGKGSGLLNRTSVQKARLLRQYPHLDANLSGTELARQLGLFQVFGCGTRRWALRLAE